MNDAAVPPAPPPLDPAAMLRSRSFVVLLVVAALVGVFVSLASWGFLELIHQTQLAVFSDLPDALGFDTVPTWWPIPVLVVAGLPVAFAIIKLPGNGGHVPAEGLSVGGASTESVPGVALAALATLGLGLVLGPEAPLIAIGGGLAIFAVKLAKKDAPPQLLMVMAAAGAFAAISVIFGSPIVAAILVIEASGLGGATLPLILIPGLIAAGIGSLVFIGMANVTALSTSAYSLQPLALPHFGTVTWVEIGWTILLGFAGALITFVVRQLGLRGARIVPRNPWLLIPAAGLATALLAVLFAETTTHGANEVLFSGQDALPGLVANAGTWSLGALAMVIICKGLAWAACLGSFRGGPTFPAIFLGAAGGIAASHLPGLSITPAVAVGMGIMVVAFLKLPLSAIVIATALTASGGFAVGPLIIVGVVVSYLVTLGLEGRLGTGEAPDAPAPAGPAPSPAAS
jgi:chloride channel protein, CIC family